MLCSAVRRLAASERTNERARFIRKAKFILLAGTPRRLLLLESNVVLSHSENDIRSTSIVHVLYEYTILGRIIWHVFLHMYLLRGDEDDNSPHMCVLYVNIDDVAAHTNSLCILLCIRMYMLASLDENLCCVLIPKHWEICDGIFHYMQSLPVRPPPPSPSSTTQNFLEKHLSNFNIKFEYSLNVQCRVCGIFIACKFRTQTVGRI